VYAEATFSFTKLKKEDKQIQSLSLVDFDQGNITIISFLTDLDSWDVVKVANFNYLYLQVMLHLTPGKA